MTKLKYSFKSKLEHHMKFPFRFRIIISSLWIFNIIWALTVLYNLPLDAIHKSQWLIVIGAMLWKNILIAIPLTIVSFGKFIKEDCDIELSINDEKLQVLYKDLKKFNYSSYPKSINILISYNIKDIIKIEKHNEGIFIISRSQEDIYDLNKKCLSSKKYFISEDIIRIPEEHISEIYEKINGLLNF